MAFSLPKSEQERSGTLVSASFPGSEQQTLFVAPKPTWREFLRWLVRGNQKEVGEAIFGKDDPEQARVNLTRILEGKNHRHFDVSWIDAVMDELGPEAEEHFVRFVCERFGFEMPTRLPDPRREEEQIAKATEAVQQLADGLSRVNETLAFLKRQHEERNRRENPRT